MNLTYCNLGVNSRMLSSFSRTCSVRASTFSYSPVRTITWKALRWRGIAGRERRSAVKSSLSIALSIPSCMASLRESKYSCSLIVKRDRNLLSRHVDIRERPGQDKIRHGTFTFYPQAIYFEVVSPFGLTTVDNRSRPYRCTHLEYRCLDALSRQTDIKVKG